MMCSVKGTSILPLILIQGETSVLRCEVDICEKYAL